MKVTIQQASIAELDKLMDWRMEVLSEVFFDWDKKDETEVREANFHYYRKMLQNGQHTAVFAELDGETIGCGGLCFYEEMPSPDNPNGLCAYLMNIYTREAFRGQGVAKQIVSYLLDCAKEKGAKKIYLETSENGRPLYEQLGFVDMVDYMKLSEEAGV